MIRVCGDAAEKALGDLGDTVERKDAGTQTDRWGSWQYLNVFSGDRGPVIPSNKIDFPKQSCCELMPPYFYVVDREIV